MTRTEALMKAAQAWCQPTTSDRVMDAALAEAFADILMREHRAGIEAAAKWVEGQNTAPHFTAQLRFTIADGIRRALPAPSPEAAAPATPTRSVSEYLSTICGDFGHPIFKLPCCLSPGHPGPHDNGSGDPWPNRALAAPAAPKEE